MNNRSRVKIANSLQCDICQNPRKKHNISECPLLIAGAMHISDTPIPPKALLTLPEALSASEQHDGSYTIKTKRPICRGTIFGPLIAPCTNGFNSGSRFVLKKSSDHPVSLDINDKNLCNWMSLVRLTEHGNSVCYQSGEQIYFAVVSELQHDSELTVSYSREYKRFLDSALLKQKEINNNPIEASLILVVPEEDNENETGEHEPNVPVAVKAELQNPKITPRVKNQKQISKHKKTKLNYPEKDLENENLKKPVSTPPVKWYSESQRRLGPLLNLNEWKCKFCQNVYHRIPDIASHLITHYKTVGAARTEKSRLTKSKESSTNSKDLTELKTGDESAELTQIVPDEIIPVYPYTCDICSCSKVFNRAEYMIRHLRKHYIGEYFCDCCLKHYSTLERLKNHICSKEGTSGGVDPGLIPESFQPHDLEPKLSTHLGNSTSTNDNKVSHLFQCNRCHSDLWDEEGLKNHGKICSISNNDSGKNDAESVCSICEKSLKPGNLNTHSLICNVIREHGSEADPSRTCPFCSEMCQDLATFHYHVTKHTHPLMCPGCHFRLRSDSDLLGHSCTMFSCDGCADQFVSFIDLRIHISSSHCEATYFCMDCGFPFATKEGLNAHKVSELAPKPAKTKPKKKKKPKEGSFVCEVCGVSYKKWNSIKTHRATHGPKKYSCDICDKTFHRREILSEHIFVHKPPQFECSDCGKKMKSKKSLEVHSRIHAGIKNFQCECGKAFTQKINLITHQMTHLPPEEKGFVCPHCGRKFSSREYLNCHIEVHEIGKTHTCDICSKSFMKSHILMHHKRVAHGSKRYSCEFCQLVLKQKHSLLRHCTSRHFEAKEIWEQDGYLNSRLIPGEISSSDSMEQRINSSTNSSGANISSERTSDAEEYGEPIETEVMDTISSTGQEPGLTTLEIIGDCVHLDGTEDELMQAGIELGQSISFHSDGNILISNEPSSVMILQVEDGDEYVLTLAPNMRGVVNGNYTESHELQDVVLEHAEAIILDPESNNVEES